MVNKKSILFEFRFIFKTIVPEAGIANIVDTQYKDSNSQCLLSFRPKSIAAKNMQNDLCLIRFKGQLREDNNAEWLPITKVYFSRLKKIDLSYEPVWVPNDISSKLTLALNSLPLKFDYCFPLLLRAFPGQLNQIDLDRANNEGNKHTRFKCYLQIYKMPVLSPAQHNEIF